MQCNVYNYQEEMVPCLWCTSRDWWDLPLHNAGIAGVEDRQHKMSTSQQLLSVSAFVMVHRQWLASLVNTCKWQSRLVWSWQWDEMEHRTLSSPTRWQVCNWYRHILYKSAIYKNSSNGYNMQMKCNWKSTSGSLQYLNVKLQWDWTDIGMKVEETMNGNTQPLC